MMCLQIYGTHCCFGKKVLLEEKLQSGPTESIYKSEEGKLQEQRRDTLKIIRMARA